MYNNTTAYLKYSNTCNLENDEQNHSFSPYVTVAWSATIAVAILSPVAVSGNALVLAAIWRNQSLRTPSYILLAGLAFTDFCTGLITQPFYFAKELRYLAYTQQETVIKGPSILKIAIADGSGSYFISLTMSIITVMSIERWLHMTRRSFFTVRRVYYTVAVLFLFPIPFVAYRVFFILKNNNINFQGSNIGSMSFLLFCHIVTSTAYLKVFKIIRRHQQQIQANYLSQTSAQPAINFAKYKNSVFTVLYILAVFYVCYFPLAIAHVLFIIWDSIYEPVREPFLDVLFVLVFLSSSLNPILYLWRMSDIRNEVTRLVKGLLCKIN